MTWDATAYFRGVLARAIQDEPRAFAMPPWAFANTLVDLALFFASLAKLGQLPLVLACHLPGVEPDEEKAVAIVRGVYAAMRKQQAAKGRPT